MPVVVSWVRGLLGWRGAAEVDRSPVWCCRKRAWSSVWPKRGDGFARVPHEGELSACLLRQAPCTPDPCLGLALFFGAPGSGASGCTPSFGRLDWKPHVPCCFFLCVALEYRRVRDGVTVSPL